MKRAIQTGSWELITSLSPGVMLQRVALDCGGTRVVALTDRRVCLGLGLAEGAKVTATFSHSAAHLIADL